jgi:hypothetical protein
MLTLAILPLIFAVVAPAAEVPQDAATFAAAGEEHLKRATTTTENQLDEFQSAHTNFDSAYLVGGATKYLCRALAVADLTLRAATFGDEQERLFWQETRQDDLDRPQQDATETGRANCRFNATGKAPRVALLGADTPALAPTTSTLHAADIPPSITEPGQAELRRSRAQTGVGAVFTGAGIGLLGVFAGVLKLERQRAGEVRGIIDAAKAEQRGYTPAEERRYLDLRDDLVRGRDVAIGVGVAGLVSLGTGVALLATRKKTRSRTYALQPYGGLQGAGAVFRLRF